MAWRIVMNKDSLVARVLKAKYFRQEDFLSVSLKQGSSHLWRSLVWGRSLLLKGLRWRVGNGKDIRAFQDPWIPRASTFRPFSTAPLEDLKVASLIYPFSHSWDLAKLDQVFVAADRDSILKIPLSFGDCNDSLIWHFDKNGEYSVKSGYRVAAQEKLSLKGSSSCPDSKWWLALWNLNIPPKIKYGEFVSMPFRLFVIFALGRLWLTRVVLDALMLPRAQPMPFFGVASCALFGSPLSSGTFSICSAIFLVLI
ncbi:hypothetical protein ACOSQ2_021837 [Xanthoceras sorbifolium]